MKLSSFVTPIVGAVTLYLSVQMPDIEIAANLYGMLMGACAVVAAMYWIGISSTPDSFRKDKDILSARKRKDERQYYTLTANVLIMGALGWYFMAALLVLSILIIVGIDDGIAKLELEESTS